MPSLVDKHELNFLRKRGKPSNSSKAFRYIRVSFSLVLKSVKNLNRISEWFSIGSRLYNAKFGRRMWNHFSGKARQILRLSKNFLPILEFPINLFWIPSKTEMESPEWLNIGSAFLMLNLVEEYKTIFLGRQGKP